MLANDRCSGVTLSPSILFHTNGTMETIGHVTVSTLLRELIGQIELFLATLDVCERGEDGGYILRTPRASLHKGLGAIWQRVVMLTSIYIFSTIDRSALRPLNAAKSVCTNVEPRCIDLPLCQVMTALHWEILWDTDGGFVTALPAAAAKRIRGVKHALQVHLKFAAERETPNGESPAPPTEATKLQPAVHATGSVLLNEAELASTATLSAAEIAKKFNLPPKALEKRLTRFRRTHSTSFVEVENRSVRQPRYLYKLNAVAFVIRSLANAASRQPTCLSDRPTNVS